MTSFEMYADIPENLRLGEALGQHCRDANITVKALVARTDVDVQQLYQLLGGKAVTFERCFARVAKVCQAAGLDLGAFVNRVVQDQRVS